jgi:hypothetical protein
MSEAEWKAAKRRGPRNTNVIGNASRSGICVVTAGVASAATDLSAAAEFGTAEFTAKQVDIIADAAVWYRWGAAGETVDETATAGANRCFLLAANERIREQPTGTHFIHKRVGGADVRVRISISSE